jgi:hypothetical protein
MIDFTDPATANQRLSNAEREQAVLALGEYAHEGRLTNVEATDRSNIARQAKTRGDLAPLFADLPPLQQEPPAAEETPAQPQQAGAAGFAQQPYQNGAPYQNGYQGYPNNYPPHGYGNWYGGYNGQPRSRAGWLVVSIMPFVALVLFFITGTFWGYQYAWLWFLLVPAAGILIYGLGGGRGPGGNDQR